VYSVTYRHCYTHLLLLCTLLLQDSWQRCTAFAAKDAQRLNKEQRMQLLQQSCCTLSRTAAASPFPARASAEAAAAAAAARAADYHLQCVQQLFGHDAGILCCCILHVGLQQ
jgi:predicted lipid-binding transport protein (Tim44 family)